MAVTGTLSVAGETFWQLVAVTGMLLVAGKAFRQLVTVSAPWPGRNPQTVVGAPLCFVWEPRVHPGSGPSSLTEEPAVGVTAGNGAPWGHSCPQCPQSWCGFSPIPPVLVWFSPIPPVLVWFVPNSPSLYGGFFP